MKSKRTFWSKAEALGEGMELGMRWALGLTFAILLCAATFKLGSMVHAGVGLIASIVALPIGFALGFFWIEIKVCARLVLQLFFGL